MRTSKIFLVLGIVALGAVALTGSLALAGEETPAAKAPEAKSPESKTEAAAPATKTPSPIHSLLKWVSGSVMPGVECGCPSTEEGAAGWRAWFAGGKDIPLAGLRDALVADGWTADKFVGFFQEMSKKGCCGESCGDCADKCDKAKGADASGAADAAPSEGSCCKKKCGGCDKSKAEKVDGSGAADAAPSEGSCCGKCKDASKGECTDGCPCAKKKAKEEAPTSTK